MVVSTHLKNISQFGSIWIISLGRGENKKYLKPPPSHAFEDSFWKETTSLHKSLKIKKNIRNSWPLPWATNIWHVSIIQVTRWALESWPFHYGLPVVKEHNTGGAHPTWSCPSYWRLPRDLLSYYYWRSLAIAPGISRMYLIGARWFFGVRQSTKTHDTWHGCIAHPTYQTPWGPCFVLF